MKAWWALLVAVGCLLVCPSLASGATTVTSDHRSVLINGTRRLLVGGSIHYPRSTPSMWPGIMAKAKAGGLDFVEVYVRCMVALARCRHSPHSQRPCPVDTPSGMPMSQRLASTTSLAAWTSLPFFAQPRTRGYSSTCALGRTYHVCVPIAAQPDGRAVPTRAATCARNGFTAACQCGCGTRLEWCFARTTSRGSKPWRSGLSTSSTC